MGAHQSLKVVVVRRPRFQEFWQTFGQPLLQKAPKIEKSFTVKERVLFRGWGGAGQTVAMRDSHERLVLLFELQSLRCSGPNPHI
jgi:hypothetical protein